MLCPLGSRVGSSSPCTRNCREALRCAGELVELVDEVVDVVLREGTQGAAQEAQGVGGYANAKPTGFEARSLSQNGHKI